MVVVACSGSSTEDFGLALRVSIAMPEKGAAGASIALELAASWNTVAVNVHGDGSMLSV